MTAPTAAQRRVLERMATGALLYEVEHARVQDGRSYFVWKPEFKVRAATAMSLIRASRVSLVNRTTTGARYRITDAGRAAVAAPATRDLRRP